MTINDMAILIPNENVRLNFVGFQTNVNDCYYKLTKNYSFYCAKNEIAMITKDEKFNLVLHISDEKAIIEKRGCISFGELSNKIVNMNIAVIDYDRTVLYVGPNEQTKSSVVDSRLIRNMRMIYGSLFIYLYDNIK